MSEFYGILTVVSLFAICMLLSFALFKIKSGGEKVEKTNDAQQIFYVAPKKKSKKQTKKTISIPIEATAVNVEDLKKYLK